MQRLILCSQQKQALKEVEKTEQKLDRISNENAELKARNKDLMGENKDLEKGMREIQQAIKEQSKGYGILFVRIHLFYVVGEDLCLW